MRNVLSSKAIVRTIAIILSLAMVITSMATPWTVKAEISNSNNSVKIEKINDGYKMTNDYFVVETGKYGQITSLKIKGDKFDTEYVMNTSNASAQNTPGHQWLGELMFQVKVGDATEYTEANTNKSDNGRTVSLSNDKVIVTYEKATGEKAIKDFKVVETYSLVGDKLRWDITVTNTNTSKLTIGDFGLPLAFNEYWSGGDEIYETRTVDHSFVGKQSSYVYVTRPSGQGQYLLMTPDTSTGAGFEYQDHWRTNERAEDEQAWCQDQAGWANGLNVFYIHSDSIKKTNRGYLDNTKLELNAGESKTYGFNFSVVDDETDMKTTLYKEGIIDAVAVPGMTYSINMPGKMYLHTAIDKEDISFDIQCPHETGLHNGNDNTVSNNLSCAKTDKNTYVKYDKTVTVSGEKYHIYDIHFGDLGQNNVIVKYNGGKSETVLQFYMMDDVATALETHSNFMVEKNQYDTPLKIGDKVFDDWMMDTKNKRGEQDSTYWLKNYWGWGDDWGLTHGEYIAEKNVYQPVAKEIMAVDQYLDIAIWNGLMREHQKDYKIHDFLMESPNTSPTYRGYAYPHIYNTYFSMYKIASKYPDMIQYTEDANTYLLRAYNILKALYGKNVSYNYETGLMGELTTPDIIAALKEEGYYTEAQTITDIMAQKYNNFKNTKYPYGSEYSYDNTGEEAVYTLAKLNNSTDTINSNTMMKKIDQKTRACRGLQPVWYHYANPTTICGENWWNFQYTASLAGYCMDDWLRLEENNLNETEKATASRVNYAAKLANLTCINSGQIDSDIENIGAVSWTYQSEMGNLGGQGTGEGKLHNGWRQMAGEADLGLFGALQILSSDVTIDPVFGLFGYGCNVTEEGDIYRVTPLDGLYTRLNFMNQDLYIELDRDQYTEAKVAKDNTSIELFMKNLEGTAHDTDININGLKPGSYRVSVNGSVTGSFQAVADETSKVSIPLPKAASAKVLIIAGAALENKAPEVILAAKKTVAISDDTRLEATAIDDGYVNSALTYTWEVVTTPEGGNATLLYPDKHITNVTFDKVGEYRFKFSAFDGELTTSKEITVKVEENPKLPETLVNYNFNDGTIIGTNKLFVDSQTGFDYAELDDNSVLVEGKEEKGVKYSGKITGGYVELPEALTKNLTKATISLDVKLTENQSNNTTLFELGDKVVIEYVDGNELIMTVNGNKVSSGITFATDYWKNIELTADGDDYALYIDGVRKAEILDTKLALSDIDTATQRYLIGRSWEEANPFLKGIIDNFIVKSYVMSDEQLKKVYGVDGERTILGGKASSIVTTVGVTPILPTKVDALYSDGVYEKVAVEWEDVKESDYAQAGKFTVNGKFIGTDIKVSITIIVVAGSLRNVAGDAIPSAIINTPTDLGGVKGLNDGIDPISSSDTSNGVWHNWQGNQGAAAWVQYNWDSEQIITGMDVYFFKDGSGNFAPAGYTIEYLNEEGSWCKVTNPVGLSVKLNQYNYTSFDPVVTKGLRMTMNPATNGCGVIEWKVYGYKEGVVLDKAALNTAIVTAEGLNSKLFAAGMDAVASALTLAKAVSTDTKTTQVAIDDATLTLNMALGSLTPVIANNIAYIANVSTSYTSSWEKSTAVNDGAVSSVSNSSECTHWGTWGNNSAYESVTYSWGTPMKINSSDLYIWTDGGGIEVPAKYVYEYRDENGNWKEVSNAVGYEVLKKRTDNPNEEANLDGFNTTTFDEVTTTALRVSVYKKEANGNGVGLVEWRVFGTMAPIITKLEDPIIITDIGDTSALVNNSTVNVTIATVTSGPAIYYTLDNTTPDDKSLLYDHEFTISTNNKAGETVTVKAIAIRNDGLASNVVTKAITFLPASEEPTPTVTPVPTEEPKPTETPVPTEEPKPTETPVPTEEPKPTETPTPTEEPKPTLTPKPTEVPKPTVTPVPTEEPKPTETPTPTAVPTQTAYVDYIKGDTDTVSSNLTIVTKDNRMEVSVQVDEAQAINMLKTVPADKMIEIPITSQYVISHMKSNHISEINIEVKMTSVFLSNSNIQHINLNLSAVLLRAAKEAGINVNIFVKDESGKDVYSFYIAGKDLENSKKEISDVNVALTVIKTTNDEVIYKIIKNKTNRKEGLKVSFNQQGDMPTQASVRIYVGNFTDKRDKKIYVYRYNPDTKKLESLPYSTHYSIDSEGYINLNLLMCSDYVILPKKAESSILVTLLEQIQVTLMKNILYLSESKTAKTNVNVMIPLTLEIVSSLDDKTSSSAVGACEITYTSSNTKIVEVDQNGNVTAEGKGKAYIIVNIKLYNNTSKIIKIQINVK
jgi:hypothetical protein